MHFRTGVSLRLECGALPCECLNSACIIEGNSHFRLHPFSRAEETKVKSNLWQFVFLIGDVLNFDKCLYSANTAPATKLSSLPHDFVLTKSTCMQVALSILYFLTNSNRVAKLSLLE